MDYPSEPNLIPWIFNERGKCFLVVQEIQQWKSIQGCEMRRTATIPGFEEEEEAIYQGIQEVQRVLEKANKLIIS